MSRLDLQRRNVDVGLSRGPHIVVIEEHNLVTFTIHTFNSIR